MKYCAFEFKSLQVGIGLYLSSTPFPSLRSSLPSPQQTGLSPLATGNSKCLMFFIFCKKRYLLHFLERGIISTNKQRYRQPQPSLLFSKIPANTFDLKKSHTNSEIYKTRKCHRSVLWFLCFTL